MNLTRLLEQSTFEFAPVLAEKQLTWRLQLTPDVPLHCDPYKLQRVFDNLFRNAVNYSCLLYTSKNYAISPIKPIDKTGQ